MLFGAPGKSANLDTAPGGVRITASVQCASSLQAEAGAARSSSSAPDSILPTILETQRSAAADSEPRLDSSQVCEML